MRDAMLFAICVVQMLAEDGRAWVGSRARGQNTVEYALVAAGIAVLALVVIGILSPAVKNAATSAASAVSNAASGAAGGGGPGH